MDFDVHKTLSFIVQKNSDSFAAPDGGGLLALAKELPDKCREVIKRQGERIPK